MIAEPGPTATNFAGGLDIASPMACYDNTPAGEGAPRSGAGNYRDSRRCVKNRRCDNRRSGWGRRHRFVWHWAVRRIIHSTEALNSRLRVLEDTARWRWSVDKDGVIVRG
ncbi:short chain dehydrogenase [Raoultella planticola]|uniref:Short chain dehydrogenase n=1 Tax=Raoultella planticola TaxID=575 RepID=A0A485ARP5_RAOPL|nr:short chain dehydrogenase [Raoultella planticola]